MPTSPIHATAGCVRLAAVVAICAGSVEACGRAGPRIGSTIDEPPPITATVLVRNHHGADLRIYVVGADGGNHRLGIVPRFGSAELVLPRALRLPAELKFVAMPMSHDSPQVSGAMLVDVGAELVLTVESDAPFSTLTRRR